ncbi:ABC transporter permease [Carboxydothermus pertinax]|uniref:Macrolide ABC transporter permease n=1 Tax=Carboxydothermus pertinax TaxID=870242 RepID=A0A1L8CVF5_9THEO|nr:ABC transporter permease [Carboxydothermus pertinax]GAV22890.1 macrolide ABC transporter permease [Carboxydothermus pertinax]
MIIESLKMALESILANKMRTFLTMLGIIIGISSVIAIVSLGQGGQNAITGEFEKIGVASVKIKVDTSKASASDYFTLADLDKIKEKVETVKYAAIEVQKQGVAITDQKNKRAVISGGTLDSFYTNNVEILYGRFFNEREFTEGMPVAIIDNNAAKALFGYEDAVGNTLKIGPPANPKKVTIIGVAKGFTGPFGGGDNMPVFVTVPLTFLEGLFSEEVVFDSMTIMATSKDAVEEAGNAAIRILEARHNNAGNDIYSAENVMQQLEQINHVLGIFTAFIGAVAAISLLVGGIGVMNIMLVSVTERTKEIGIRKAIGATTTDILVQFLMESIIISVIGGIIGMVVGIVGANIVGNMMGVVPALSWTAALGVILFSSAVGIFFGIYPARKAAKLDPIESLRYE